MADHRPASHAISATWLKRHKKTSSSVNSPKEPDDSSPLLNFQAPAVTLATARHLPAPLCQIRRLKGGGKTSTSLTKSGILCIVSCHKYRS